MTSGRKPLPHMDPARSTQPAPPRPVADDEIALAEWTRIAPLLVELGLLTELDTALLAGYCRAWSRWVQAEQRLQQFGAVIKGHRDRPSLSPFTREANEAMRQISQIGSEFGLSPVARAKIFGPSQLPAITQQPSTAEVTGKIDENSIGSIDMNTLD